MSERIPYLYIATGQKGVGKSYRTVNMECQDYITQLKRPVLIFDVNQEYPEYQAIDFDLDIVKPDRSDPKKKIPHEKGICKQVIEFSEKSYRGNIKPSIKRVLPLKKNGDEMNVQEKQFTASLLMKYFKHGLVLLEDINNYTLGARSISMIGAICTNRQRSQDIIVHLQSMEAIDPRLWQNVNIIRMHHQPSGFDKIANKCPNLEIMKLAKYIVDDEYFADNKRVCVYINVTDNKIVACTNASGKLEVCSEEKFEKACKKYLQQNPSVLNSIMKEVDLENGGKKYTRQGAIDKFISDNKRLYL